MRRRLWRHAGLASSVAVGVLAMACSSGGPGIAPPDLSMLPPDLTILDLKDNGYPPQPWGPNVGDTLPDFTFQGYWAPKATSGLASSQPFGEVTFGMLHASGARFALIEFGAFY
jgi:hypothetical protein